MGKQLEEIFNECVERLRQGDSIDNCLRSYPGVAAELEILLRTAVNVNWRASMVQPRPEFKYRARAQFINAQWAASQEKIRQSRPTFFSIQRAWAPALAMVMLLVFSTVGTAAAAANAMPDEPLYPVKIATEQVRLTLAVSDEAKAELNVKLVETRSQEIITMATQGKPEQVAVATARLAENLEAAEAAIIKVEQAKTKQVTVPPRPTPLSPVQPIPAPPVTAPPPPTPSTAPRTTAPSTTTPSTNNTTKNITGQTGDQKLTSLEAEKLRQSLKARITKNLTALEDAHDKAPDKVKEALRRTIEMTKNKESQIDEPGRFQNKDKNTVPDRPLPPNLTPKTSFPGTNKGAEGQQPTPSKGTSGIIQDSSKTVMNSGTTTYKR